MKSFQLTDTDRSIITELVRDGRIGYQDLARKVGIPTSTCHGRVRALENAGIIRGYHADIDPEAIGHDVNALIMLRLTNQQRDRLPALTQHLRSVPGVQQVFLIGGDKDLVIHVACPNVPALRDLIAEKIAPNPAFAQTQTQIVFEHGRGHAPIFEETT